MLKSLKGKWKNQLESVMEFTEIKNRVSKEEYNYKDYLDDKLFVESWESSMVVTTFVQFFHTIIVIAHIISTRCNFSFQIENYLRIQNSKTDQFILLLFLFTNHAGSLWNMTCF